MEDGGVQVLSSSGPAAASVFAKTTVRTMDATMPLFMGQLVVVVARVRSIHAARQEDEQ